MKKMLVVDDEIGILRMFQQLFPDWKVYLANDYYEAVETFKSVPDLDFFITDYNLHDERGSGMDLLTEVLSIRNIPHALMSGSFRNLIEMPVLNKHDNGFSIEKPFFKEELYSKIEEVLNDKYNG